MERDDPFCLTKYLLIDPEIHKSKSWIRKNISVVSCLNFAIKKHIQHYHFLPFKASKTKSCADMQLAIVVVR